MIGTSSIAGIGLMLAGGIIIPLVVCIWWLRKSKVKVSTILIGAATWLLFAMVLERFPLYLLFNPQTELGQTINNSVVLYAVIAAFLAGLFEETGRLVAFKTVLKKHEEKETAISYGIGHGGLEALLVLGLTGVQYMIYATMIKSGTFQEVIDQAAASGIDPASLEALPGQIAAITPVTGLVALIERASAMIIHVALSIMVFYAARDSRMKLYGLAILIHMLFDIPAALYQKGVLNLYVCEVIIAVFAVATFVIVYKTLYQKDETRQVRRDLNDYYVERINR